MAKKGKRKKKRRVERENRRAMILISVVVLLLFFVLFAESRRLGSKLEVLTHHRQKLERELAEEELRTVEIEALRARTQTDEYIKQAAKDRLGLVEEGEIVFRARSGETGAR